jgi:hypothetical protein
MILIPFKRVYDKLIDAGFMYKSANKFQPTALRKLIHHPIYNIIEYYNSVYRGICMYFRICTNRSLLQNIHFLIKSSCVLTIAMKMKLHTISKVLKRYGKNLIVIENNSKISFVR